MKMTEVHVSFEKRVSDGNFGGECSRVDLTGTVEDGDDPMVCIEVLLNQARNRVYVDLGQSQTASIRRQIQPPFMVKVRAAAQAESDLEELPDFEEVRT